MQPGSLCFLLGQCQGLLRAASISFGRDRVAFFLRVDEPSEGLLAQGTIGPCWTLRRVSRTTVRRSGGLGNGRRGSAERTAWDVNLHRPPMMPDDVLRKVGCLSGELAP
mmetsp:Transcript_18229/g.27321  ORF Transcript_18229/g.27321 Transcript_18229/m.27321 type:complete len:109 (+) Transcript_18229:217-543(+)